MKLSTLPRSIVLALLSVLILTASSVEAAINWRGWSEVPGGGATSTTPTGVWFKNERRVTRSHVVHCRTEIGPCRLRERSRRQDLLERRSIASMIDPSRRLRRLVGVSDHSESTQARAAMLRAW